MHDIRSIRENPEAFDAALIRRGCEPVAAQIIDLDAQRRAASTLVQEAQNRRNEASKLIGQAMAKGDSATADALKAEVAELKQTLPAMEEDDRRLSQALDDLLAAIPNLPADDVPDGADESANVEVSRWGTPREFGFIPREHADIGPMLGMDFETGALISGARFTFLKGQMARLHRALAQFMLDKQTTVNGYLECNPPLLVRDASLYGTGQLPKFAEDSYAVETGLPQDELDRRFREFLSSSLEQSDNNSVGIGPEFFERFHSAPFRQGLTRKWLIPTAEVSLTNAVREAIIDDLTQPIRMTALTPCFRSEAGAAGKDTRGFIRQHQFEKCELVSVCRPEDAEREHEHMVRSAEGILEALDLPYRKVLLCTGDMGFGARKTFDLEVWLPGQGAFREISSVSWCGDFQARRMNTRYRPEAQKGTAFVHTLNGSGLAVGRTLVAVIENYQQEDGSVLIPEALLPYTGGLTRLEPAA